MFSISKVSTGIVKQRIACTTKKEGSVSHMISLFEIASKKWFAKKRFYYEFNSKVNRLSLQTTLIIFEYPFTGSFIEKPSFVYSFLPRTLGWPAWKKHPCYNSESKSGMRFSHLRIMYIPTYMSMSICMAGIIKRE